MSESAGSLPSRTDGGRGITDLLLTAANRGQARGLLRTLRGDPALADLLQPLEPDRGLPTIVAPDRGGRRVGSGRATIDATVAWLRRADRQRGTMVELRDRAAVAAALEGRRIAVIHSGGDARRLPAHAAEGKVLVPLPPARGSESAATNVRTPTLLEWVLRDLDSVRLPARGGLLVASGDLHLDLVGQALSFSGDAPEVVVFAAPLARASRHGVLVADHDGTVRRGLQKPDEAKARTSGAIRPDGLLLVDTGLVFVPIATLANWIATAAECGLLAVPTAAVDLYADLLPVLAIEHEGNFSEDAAGSFLAKIRERDHGRLRVRELKRCAFRHPGSTREFLVEAAGLGTPVPRAFIRDASLADGSMVAMGAIVEASRGARVEVPRGSMVIGVVVDEPIEVRLPAQTGLVMVPQWGGGHAAIAFGIDDDFKTTRDGGGTFAGRPLSEIPRDAWPDDEPDRSLWRARLWTVGTQREALAAAMARLEGPGIAIPPEAVSAAEIFARADHRTLLQERLAARRAAAEHAIVSGVPSLEEARLGRIASSLALAAGDAVAAARFRQAAVRAVERAVAESGEGPPRIAKRVRPARRVVVRAPARIDLAGGWTDTPPICIERGGSVVNIAVEVDGAPPLEAVAERIAQPVVRIESEDLGRVIEFSSSEELLRRGDPRDPEDWALLPRTAVAMVGVPRDCEDLSAALREEGGGLSLRIASRLPKGSGLGTSSILGSAAIAALAALRGHDCDRDELMRWTSQLEQRMGTAGGWQDQAGGATPGAKLLTTLPSSDQVPTEQTLQIDSGFWDERILVHSTGLQRLARNILQQVVWRWLGGGRRVDHLIGALQENAHRLAEELRRGDMDALVRETREYWRLKVALDPGSTTLAIESMVDPIRDDLAAWSLPGAGGGGFLFLVAKNAEAARRIRRRFTEHPPHRGSRFHTVLPASAGVTVVERQ